MTAQIIDGKATARLLEKELALEAQELQKERALVPGLAVVLVGDDPASRTYVNNKERACKRVGIYSEVHRLPGETSQEEVLALIHRLNHDPAIHGILVQLPLPKHISDKACIQAIKPEKDVDGFHPISAGNLLIGDKGFVPCTPHGILVLLDRLGVDLKGKHAVIVGRSNIVGKPVALLLLSRHATVTICHSRTPDLGLHTRQADVLVVAIGRAEMVTGDMVKPGAVVIDVGVNQLGDKLVGDVHFASAQAVAGAITPVPGGVGPMTIGMLMKNTIQAARWA
ncbi:MAG TPA: bifunctional methylenetetrahydrofolate dehydrogenase/methenyltetrahydrofolate cyclohydrolase FolD [Clostridiales bacterium UBA8153]|nr:bifunctional methylenetetrahydrofolate dehydrogenase/methenyltetrahydrofolate cyclohydrolase FolD [Clostridiales bacterium UBA8153]